LRSLFGLLSDLERRKLTGLARYLSAAGEELGCVMATQGRICFAVCRDDHRPVGAILREIEPAVGAHVEAAVKHARRRGGRLCEALLATSAVPLPTLRQALCRQISNALLRVAAAVDVPTRIDCRPARDDYDPRLTFTTMEAFIAAVASTDSAPLDGASRVYGEYAEDADAAVLFLRHAEPSGLPLPVAANGLDQATLADLGSLARDARSIAAPTTWPVDDPVRLALLCSSDAVWLCANGERRTALVRTNASFGAGQIFGFAWRTVLDSMPRG
jgi:hypothetical protein